MQWISDVIQVISDGIIEIEYFLVSILKWRQERDRNEVRIIIVLCKCELIEMESYLRVIMFDRSSRCRVHLVVGDSNFDEIE